MKSQSEVNNKSFREWYQSLPYNKVRGVREDVQKYCGIQMATFYRWLSGKTPIPHTAQVIINQVAGKKVFEVDQPVPINHE